MVGDEDIDFRDLLLHQGVDAWNAWRRDHPDISPNLFNQDLQERNLAGIPQPVSAIGTTGTGVSLRMRIMPARNSPISPSDVSRPSGKMHSR